MYDDLHVIAERSDVLLFELAELTQAGPTLRFVHRFQVPYTTCMAGEEIWAIFLVHRGREFRLPLSLALRQLLNYLAEMRHIPQSATQIAAGIRRSTFYIKHGLNSGLLLRRKISRSAVKIHIMRLRAALRIVFREAALAMDPKVVLVSRPTVSNEVHYQLRATIEWAHIADDVPAWFRPCER